MPETLHDIYDHLETALEKNAEINLYNEHDTRIPITNYNFDRPPEERTLEINGLPLCSNHLLETCLKNGWKFTITTDNNTKTLTL